MFRSENAFCRIFFRNLALAQLRKEFARNVKKIPRVTQREVDDELGLPDIEKYLIQDEKMLASRIVNAVQDTNQYPQLFEEYKSSLQPRDLHMMLVKYIQDRNQGGIYEFEDLKIEGFGVEDHKFIQDISEQLLGVLEHLEEHEVEFMTKMLVIVGDLREKSALRLLQFYRQNSEAVSLYLAP